MTTITASCPDCGSLELTGDDVILVVCNQPDRSYYEFRCTSCQEWVRKPAPADIVRQLRSGGVPEKAWTIPDEALEVSLAPALCWDDVLDFTLALRRADADPIASLVHSLVYPEQASR